MTSKIIPFLSVFLLPAALILAAPQEKPSAPAGDPEVLFQQARTALHAEGGPGDPVQVFALMKQAADQGHAEAEAGLGYLYSVGTGTPKDDALAVAWFRKAADKGSAKGQFNLGRMIANGRGAVRNPEEGFQWMQRAAAQNLPEAVFAVGEARYLGKFGQRIDYKQAYPSLLQAAEGGMAGAQNIVGLMHRDGKGVQIDRKQAEAWLRKAAAQNDLRGQSNLGHLLSSQPGERAAKIEGLKWLLVAKQRGDVLATKTFELLLPTIPEADLAEARRLARGIGTRAEPSLP